MKKLFLAVLCLSTLFASCKSNKDASGNAAAGITVDGKLEIGNIVLFEGFNEQNSLVEKPLKTGKIEVLFDYWDLLATIPLSADGKASLDFAPYLSRVTLTPVRDNFGFSSNVTISDETAQVASFALDILHPDVDGEEMKTKMTLSPQTVNTNEAVDGLFITGILYCSKATHMKGTQVIDDKTIQIDMNLRAGWNMIGGPIYIAQNRSVLSANNLPENCRWIAYDFMLE